jgi:hypothetical protein
MAKRKRTRGQTTIYKTYTWNEKSSNTNPLKTGGELRCSRKVTNSCSTNRIRRATNPVILKNAFMDYAGWIEV